MAADAKICGITTAHDARVAVQHGAWRLGVIFAGGPRHVDAATARSIVAAAGGVPVVGVFGTAPMATILRMIEETGLRGAQLHGEFTAADADLLTAAGVEVWQVARFNDAATLDDEMARIGRSGAGVLVEPRLAGGGGQGVALPAELARRARAALAGRYMLLAGGLRPESVSDAIRLVGPDGVDVSSGVELAPGIKDPARLAAFLEAVRDARPAA